MTLQPRRLALKYYPLILPLTKLCQESTSESTVPGAATVETPAAAKPTEKKAPAKPANRKYVYREDDDESESDSLEYKDDEDDEDFAFGEEDDEDDESVSEDRSESA